MAMARARARAPPRWGLPSSPGACHPSPMRFGMGVSFVVAGAVASLAARPARADGVELEARAGSLTQSFKSYDVSPVKVGWASFVAFDASLRYYIQYFFAGVGGGYAFSVAQTIEGQRGETVDSNARLWNGALEIGTHLRVGAWAFRPGVAGGVHALSVSLGTTVCRQGGVSATNPVVACDDTAATPHWFVQPRFAFDRRVTDLVYVGGLVGLDIPTAGPVAQLVVGIRAREREREDEPPRPVRHDDGKRPFDRGAAAKALHMDYSACRDPNGPFGELHVKAVFAPDGTVADVLIDRPDDPFLGTEIAACVQRMLRGISVPPFDPPNVTVGKTIPFRE